MEKTRWDNWSAAIVYMVLFVGDFIVNTMIWTAHPTVTTALALVILGGTLYAAERLDLFHPWKEFLIWRTVRMLGLGMVLIYLTQILGNLLIIWQYGEVVQPQNQQNIIDAQMPAYLLFVIVVCQGPVLEEVTMRGILMGRLLKRRPFLGLVLSSLIFGILHGPTDLGSWIYYGGMGLVFAYLYYRTKQLEVVILLHICNNLIGFLRMLGIF